MDVSLSPLRGTRGRKSVSVAAVAVALGVAFLYLNVLTVVPALDSGISDYTFYWRASKAVLNGLSPYTVPDHITLPFTSLLMAPLALLPYGPSRVVWFAVSGLFLVASALWTVRALGADRLAALSVAAVWTCAGSVAINLRAGQVNPLLLLLLCLAIFPPPGGRGVWIRPVADGAASAIKIFPGIVAIGDALRRRTSDLIRSVLAITAFVMVPLGIVTFLLKGPRAPTRAGFWMGTPAVLNCSLPALALRILDPPSSGQPLPRSWFAGHNPEMLQSTKTQAAVSLTVSVGALLVGVAVTIRLIRRAGPMVDAAAVDWALVALSLVAAPLAWGQYQILLLPGVARLVSELWRSRRWCELGGLGVAFLAANWAEPLARGPYLSHYGRIAGPLPVVWLVAGLAPIGSVAIWLLHLRSIGRVHPIGSPAGC